MKTIIACFLLATITFLFAGCNSIEGYARQDYDFAKVKQIAVVSVEGQIAGEAAKNQVADYFTLELLKKGYAPVERAQVQTILEEQQFQAQNLTPSETAVKAGQILNIPAALVINITTKGEEISMTAKMLHVEDGSILWMATASGSTGRTLATIAGAAVGAGAGVAVSGKDDRVIGGIVGGVLGGVAGRALSPQVAEKIKDLTSKMGESIPSASLK